MEGIEGYIASFAAIFAAAIAIAVGWYSGRGKVKTADIVQIEETRRNEGNRLEAERDRYNTLLVSQLDTLRGEMAAMNQRLQDERRTCDERLAVQAAQIAALTGDLGRERGRVDTLNSQVLEYQRLLLKGGPI